jgi:pilus assembly protein Flp/PilA
MVMVCRNLSIVAAVENQFLEESGLQTGVFGTLILRELLSERNLCQRTRRTSGMNLLKSTLQFLQSEDGTTAVEYAVLLAMILIAIVFGVTSAGGGVSGWWGNIKTEIEAY